MLSPEMIRENIVPIVIIVFAGYMLLSNIEAESPLNDILKIVGDIVVIILEIVNKVITWILKLIKGDEKD